MTDAIETPDLDALVSAALRAADLGASVYVLMPERVAEHVPTLLVRHVAGGAATRLGTVVGMVSLQALAPTRREASELARRAVSALIRAARAQFAHGGAHLGTVTYATGAPIEVRTGSPAPDPGRFRFQTTLRVTARTTL